MKLLIEIETDDSGRAIRARIVEGGIPKARKKRAPVTRRAVSDSADITLLRSFLAIHGVVEAARMLRVTRGAVYNWLHRSSIPAKHLGEIERINLLTDVDE